MDSNRYTLIVELAQNNASTPLYLLALGSAVIALVLAALRARVMAVIVLLATGIALIAGWAIDMYGPGDTEAADTVRQAVSSAWPTATVNLPDDVIDGGQSPAQLNSMNCTLSAQRTDDTWSGKLDCDAGPVPVVQQDPGQPA